MTDENPIDDTTGGLDRRSLIKRGAVVGGALVWTTPVVQAIASPAFGATPSDDDGGGAGDPVCLDRNRYYFKYDPDGLDSLVPGPGNTQGLGNCITASEATAAGVVAGTAEIQGLITVTITGTTAQITITGGYALQTTMATGDADGFTSEGQASNNCDAIFYRLLSTSSDRATRTYSATSTARNARGNLQDISHLELVVVCA